MKIRILASASRDLVDGFRFYEKQAAGVGEYFIDSLYADIDSLLVNAGLGRLELSCHCERSEAIP
jgi:hypothetical protein